jgi:uncharacterized protein
MSSPARTEDDGSRLCLACGLCCQGIFHKSAKIRTDEVQAARRLGLPVLATDEGPAFSLPCPRHAEDRCTVYAERPSPCRGYQCKLLQRYLDGESTLEEGLARVRMARQLVARVRQRLGPETPSNGLWQQLRALGEERITAALTDRELLMDLLGLLTLSHQHFQNRAQPREVWESA